MFLETGFPKKKGLILISREKYLGNNYFFSDVGCTASILLKLNSFAGTSQEFTKIISYSCLGSAIFKEHHLVRDLFIYSMLTIKTHITRCKIYLKLTIQILERQQ